MFGVGFLLPAAWNVALNVDLVQRPVLAVFFSHPRSREGSADLCSERPITNAARRAVSPIGAQPQGQMSGFGASGRATAPDRKRGGFKIRSMTPQMLAMVPMAACPGSGTADVLTFPSASVLANTALDVWRQAD